MGGLLGEGGGGGGGGAKGNVGPLQNYWGAWPPLFLRLCVNPNALRTAKTP